MRRPRRRRAPAVRARSSGVVHPAEAVLASISVSIRWRFPIHVAVNCQLCPVLSDVAFSTRIGTFAARRQLWSFGEKPPGSPFGAP